MLTRRGALKTIGVATLAALLKPQLLLPETPAQLAPAATDGALFVDGVTKTIQYRGDAITVHELYRQLQELWDQPEMMTLEAPLTRATDHFVKINPGWTIDETTFKHIYDGTIVDTEDNIWTSFMVPDKSGGTRIFNGTFNTAWDGVEHFTQGDT